MLIPLVLLQGFLVFIARRVHAFEVETKAYQEARVRLLSEPSTPRTRSASGLPPPSTTASSRTWRG
jgi:hypothetical protein